MTAKTVKVLSLGAGVQSSAMLLAYLNGVLKDPPDFCVFADTQSEPQGVYDWLAKLQALAAGKIEIVIATAGSLVDDYLNRKRFAAIPFFTINDDGSHGMGRRQCTSEYKIRVIEKCIRIKLGYQPRFKVRHKVESLIGISTDEADRMKPSRTPWITNRWPLVDELGWSRGDCYRYLKTFGIGEPPKSACYVCPYRSNESWRDLKKNEPAAFEKAVQFERVVQERKAALKFRGTPFLHSSRKPLDKVDFDALAPESRELFTNECEGMCGV